MKKNNVNHANLFKSKLFQLLLVVSMLMPGMTVKSQETTAKSNAVYPTFGVGFGFFHPEDVNDYIEYSLPSGYISEYGTEDIFMLIDLHAGITFRMKRFDISAMLEYDIAPKFIIIEGADNQTHVFSRVAPGITANIYIPVGTGRHAFFLGGNVNYSFMSFKDFRASSPGFKLQLGFSMQFGKFNLQPFGAFNYASGKDTDNAAWGKDFSLNYTNGQVGVYLSFHPAIN